LFALAGVWPEKYPFAFYLLDRIAKLSPEQRGKQYAENAVTDAEKPFFEKLAAGQNPLQSDFWSGTGRGAADFRAYADTIAQSQQHIEESLALMNLPNYARYDPSIVRGLAYYTGFV